MYGGVTGKAGDRLPMSIVRPCASPAGKLCHGTKLNGSGTRSAQTALAKKVEFGSAAKPRPKAGEIPKKQIRPLGGGRDSTIITYMQCSCLTQF